MKLRHGIAAAALAAAAPSLPAAAQTTPAAPAAVAEQGPATLIGTTQFDLPSKITGRTYRIFVFKPTPPPPPGGYPVVYFSDGNALFGTAAVQMMLRQMGELRPAIIVGIGYPATNLMQPMIARNRDLTPSTPAEKIPPAMLALMGKEGGFGGAEPFYRFLVEELRPMIASTYRADPADQTLFGDSLGGLFALHVLFNHPESFRTFVAASPSIWWNDRAVLNDEPAFEAKVAAGTVAPRLLITVGGLEQPQAGAGAAPRPGAPGAMIDNARALAERLSALKGGTGYVVRFHVFPDETHSSVIPAAISRGLGFALGPQK